MNKELTYTSLKDNDDDLSSSSSSSSDSDSSDEEQTHKERKVEENNEIQLKVVKKGARGRPPLKRAAKRKNTLINHCLKHEDQELEYKSSTRKQQVVPLKLVFRRASGNNNYEVTKASNSSRPKREATLKKRYKFNEETSDFEKNHEPPVKKVRINNNNRQNSTKKIKRTNEETVDELNEDAQIDFQKEDIVSASIIEKVNIFNNQPNIRLNHSSPFPIALVEEHTGIIYTKGLLLNHLFQSYSSPCILCPLCKYFLSVSQFTKHLHDDIDSDLAFIVDKYEKIKRINKILKNKSFNILPYCIKNAPITENATLIWKDFGYKYTKFKREQSIKVTKNANKLNESSKTLNSNEKREFFSNWDYVTESKQLFLLDESNLSNENIVYCDVNGEEIETEKVFKEQHDSKKYNLENQNQELDLSEDEDETNQIKDQCFESIVSSFKPTLPKMSNRFNNFYDNSTAELLLYICDNQFTVIPLSFIDYIDSKRIKINEMLKDKRNFKFRKMRLSHSLNLEINICSDKLYFNEFN